MRGLIRAFLLITGIGGLCAMSGCEDRIAPPQGAKRLIVNDDGHGGFYGGSLKSAEALRKHPQRFQGTHLWIYQWGVMLGTTVNYPSKVLGLCGGDAPQEVLEQVRSGDRTLAQLLKRLADEGVDSLQCVAQGCHEAGLLCYVTIRANPCYGMKAAGWPDGSMARVYNGKFWWDHPEYRVVTKAGKQGNNLSYAFPEVRAIKLSLVKEVLERDIDGIDIDFLRHPPVLGYEAPLVQGFQARSGADPTKLPDDDARWVAYRCEVMTEFMREVRKLADAASKAKGRRLGVSVRVDHKQYRLWGLDIEAWMNEGLIDILCVAQYGLGGYVFDLTPFATMAKGTGCLVFASEEAITSGHDPTPEEEAARKAGKPVPERRGVLSLADYCERARRWYAEGATGIHLFNEGRVEVLKTLGDRAAFLKPDGKE